MRGRRIAVLSFELVARGALSVGDPQHEDVKQRIGQALADVRGDEMLVDVPIAKNPCGEPVVRGTSVFGALRSHLAGFDLTSGITLQLRSIDSREKTTPAPRRATLADLLCGSEPEELGEGARPALRPSALRLVSTELLPGWSSSDGATRTAVSRTTGAAEARKLFRREELNGAHLRVIIEVDLAVLEASLLKLSPQAGVGAALDDLVTAVKRWRPRLGGRVGTGWGAVDLTQFRLGIADPVGLTELLAAESTVALYDSLLPRHKAAAKELRISQQAAVGPAWSLSLDLVAADFLLLDPRQDPVGDRNNRAVSSDRVAGSSWRGLLRARSEFILRSCGIPACLSSEGEQICGRCPTCELFGWAPGPCAETGAIGSRGLVTFNDSPVTGERVSLDHAPVDRFTGGAADQKLFTRECFAPGARLTLTIEQTSDRRPVPTWATRLLTLAVRDLVEGLIGVGNSTTRGYGTVRLADDASLPPVPTDWLDHVPGDRQAVGA